jgi:hypothetical protein
VSVIHHGSLRSCSTADDCPGARTVKESSPPFAATVAGTYFTLTPVKVGLFPAALVMENVSAGIFDIGPRGSLRIVMFSLPMLVSVVTSLRFSTPSTESGPGETLQTEKADEDARIVIPETFNESPGAAETATAEITRKTSVEWSDMGDIARSGGYAK